MWSCNGLPNPGDVAAEGLTFLHISIYFQKDKMKTKNSLAQIKLSWRHTPVLALWGGGGLSPRASAAFASRPSLLQCLSVLVWGMSEHLVCLAGDCLDLHRGAFELPVR